MNVAVIILIFLSGTSFAQNDPSQFQIEKPFFLFGGLNIGLSTLTTDIPGEASDKQGFSYGATVLGTYFYPQFAINGGLGWFEHRFESEVQNGTQVKLLTRTFYLELNPLYRLQSRWSVGPHYQRIIGEKFLVAPGVPVRNIDADDLTSSDILGMTVFYEFPWKRKRTRFGIHFSTPLGVGDRDVYMAKFSLEMGFPFFEKTSNLVSNVSPGASTPLIQSKNVEVRVKLDEQLINFKTGSATLDQQSLDYLRFIGKFLKANPDRWEQIRVEGHTDVRGDANFNRELSLSRAIAVTKAMLEGGAPSTRLFYQGHGEDRPIRLGESAEDHEVNRRVEINFLGKTDTAFINEGIERAKAASVGLE